MPLKTLSHIYKHYLANCLWNATCIFELLHLRKRKIADKTVILIVTQKVPRVDMPSVHHGVNKFDLPHCTIQQRKWYRKRWGELNSENKCLGTSAVLVAPMSYSTACIAWNCIIGAVFSCSSDCSLLKAGDARHTAHVWIVCFDNLFGQIWLHGSARIIARISFDGV